MIASELCFGKINFSEMYGIDCKKVKIDIRGKIRSQLQYIEARSHDNPS